MMALDQLITRMTECGSLCEIEANVNLLVQLRMRLEAP